MQAIKALVMGMGMLLVIGIGLLGYGLYRNATKGTGPETAETEEVDSFGTIRLPVAAGGRVAQMQEVDGRLALLLDEGASQRIVVLDLDSGSVAGTVQLVPQP